MGEKYVTRMLFGSFQSIDTWGRKKLQNNKKCQKTGGGDCPFTFELSTSHTRCSRLFFQHFCENSSAKKTQNLPFGQKLKPIFVQKLKLGAAFLNIRKNLMQVHNFNILPKNYTSSKYVLNSQTGTHYSHKWQKQVYSLTFKIPFDYLIAPQARKN